MTHAARGGKGVVDEGKVVKTLGLWNSAGNREDGVGNVVDRGGGEGSSGKRVGGEEGSNFLAQVLEGIGEIDVVDKGLIYEGTGGFGEGRESAIDKVTIAPEIYSAGVTMLANEPAVENSDIGEVIIIGGGSDEVRAEG